MRPPAAAKLYGWFKNGRNERRVRYKSPKIVAYYWDGGAPKKHHLKDISQTGAYVYTKEFWCVGTILMVTLQGDSDDGANVSPLQHISLPCKIVRHGSDGMGVTFMTKGTKRQNALEQFISRCVRLSHSPYLVRSTSEGQALVEFALMAVPLLFLLIFFAMNFGYYIYTWITVSNAVRAAADYAILSGSSAGLPNTAAQGSLQSLISADLTYLPNQSSSNPQVCVQQNNNGAYTNVMETPSGACATIVSNYGNPPLDSEFIAAGSTTHYVDITADITYTFSPLFPFSSFLQFRLAALPGTIHRRAVMRIE